MQKNIWIAAKYLRLSIEDGDKAESESIVNQSILIDNYMKSTSDITIVETFKDDGFSGTDFKRPGFQAMLKAIENKEINCIIVKDLSRFGREHIDVDRYMLLQYVEKINVFEGKKIEIVYRFQDELVTAARLAEQIGKTKQEVAV